MHRLLPILVVVLTGTLLAMAPQDWRTLPPHPGASFGGAVSSIGGGACCLVDQCVDVADEAECSGLGGIFLPGASCADDACGIGACCFEQACNETDAFSCITAGREFGGAGTTCLDDPCDAGVGACCFADGSCQDLSPEDCAAAAGTWLGAGTNCGQMPCELGACCFDNGSCLDVARYICDDMGGTFFAGEACIDNPCGPQNDCPGPNLYGQQRDEPQDFLAMTSEASAGLIRYDDFTSVNGAIDSLIFYGLDLEFVGGGFIECVESDPTFDIAFYTDAGGRPGLLVCEATVTATRTPLGVSYLGAELNEYAVTLPEPCVLVHGWISIVGQGDPSCWFLWMSAGLGSSWCDGCFSQDELFDAAFCLQGTSGGIFGACCTDADGMCADGVEIVDCITTDQRFVPDATCADLEPPCGVILGACCFPDATCDALEEEDCAIAGGSWLGANTLCEHCPCITPCVAGGIVEGEPDCFAGYLDLFNAGCFADQPVFTPIDIEDDVCGRSGVYLFDSEQVPDLDYYEFTLTSTVNVSASLTAEFPARLALVDGSIGCPGTTLAVEDAFECDTATIARSLDPGRYWLVVLPIAFTDSSECGARYVLETSGSGCPADVDGSGAVDVGDLLALLAAWGPCGACFEDITGDGFVDVNDLLVVLGTWGPCD